MKEKDEMQRSAGKLPPFKQQLAQAAADEQENFQFREKGQPDKATRCGLELYQMGRTTAKRPAGRVHVRSYGAIWQ